MEFHWILIRNTVELMPPKKKPEIYHITMLDITKKKIGTHFELCDDYLFM